MIPNAVPLDGVPRARHGRNTPVLASVGRLKAPKDFTTLLRALAALPDAAVEAVIAGEGPDRPTLEAEIERLGIGDRVRLLGERRDVPVLLGAADVFVLSSRSEGLPVSVLEAMVAGLPVVASRVGGVAELVEEGATGLLVAPGDPGELAAALERVLTDRELRRRLGAAGRVRVEQHFDLESFRRAHLDLYYRELTRKGLPVATP